MYIYFYSFEIGKFKGLKKVANGEGIIKSNEKILDIDGFNGVKKRIEEHLEENKVYNKDSEYLQIIGFSYLGKDKVR